MADIADHASDLETLQRDIALKHHTGKFSKPSNKYCEDCGTEINEERRALGGVTRCVYCQSLAEKEGRC